MNARARRGTGAGPLAVLCVALGCASCLCAQGGAGAAPPGTDGGTLRPEYLGADAKRDRIAIVLVPVVTGFDQPTDLQVVPTDPGTLVVLEKGGTARWTALDGSATGKLLDVQVLTRSEEGLLGLAFHPRFAENGRFFLDYVTAVNGADTTRIEEWIAETPDALRTSRVRAVRTILEVEQPFPNHNAGQLAFGPDGFLYVGLGDGGSGGDPQENGQDPGKLLGKMLRLDVDRALPGQPYGIPAGNPFVGVAGARPELWAVGLRNPWRYSFAPDGRLIVADVGQDRFEELDVVEGGKNYGWDVREAGHCYEPKDGCATEGLVDPILEYGRDDGQSVTGGYVYGAGEVPALRGKYVFGDFVAGKLWAVELPAGKTGGPPDLPMIALGKFPILPVAFGRLPDGGVLVADFGGGTIFRIAPAPKPGA